MLYLAALACGIPAQAADPLSGRLFHTPAERAAMDHPLTPRQPHPAHPPPAPVRAGEPVQSSPRLSGFVLRSDGRDSFWLSAPPAEPATGPQASGQRN